MIIRTFRDADVQTLWKIYYDTTHIVNGRDYTREQCERWAPSSPDLTAWGDSLRRSATFVAVDDAGEIIGFAQIGGGGEIGLFYCRHDRLGQGVGKSLYAAIENEARVRGFKEITADVSVTAKGFFLSRGFEVVREQRKIICGAVAPNSVMRKSLLP